MGLPVQCISSPTVAARADAIPDGLQPGAALVGRVCRFDSNASTAASRARRACSAVA